MLHVVPSFNNAILHLFVPVVSPIHALRFLRTRELLLHTGYVICNIDRAAAASSPHMISLTTMSPDRSSDRRIGRPTIDGYECSGKFYRIPSVGQYLNEPAHRAPPLLEAPAHLRCIANLEEPSPSIEDYNRSACCRRSRYTDKTYQWVPLPSLDQVTRVNLACCCMPGSSTLWTEPDKRGQARQQPQVHLGLAHHFGSWYLTKTTLIICPSKNRFSL